MKPLMLSSGDDPDSDSKSTAKARREDKIEAAQEYARVKIEGKTLIPKEEGTLWYLFPEEHNGHKILVLSFAPSMFPQKATLQTVRETLQYHGKYDSARDSYLISTDKLEDLMHVLDQMKVKLKKVGPNGDAEGRG